MDCNPRFFKCSVKKAEWPEHVRITHVNMTVNLMLVESYHVSSKTSHCGIVYMIVYRMVSGTTYQWCYTEKSDYQNDLQRLENMQW